jgi:RimJ/RimL family protein N-acetyltransferase
MQIFLETERLVLRQFTEDDVDNLVELDSDPDVMHFINGGRPTPRREIESDVLPMFLDYYERFVGYGFWAAIEKSSGRFVGWFHFRPAAAAHPDEVELGYRLLRSVWGKGYATEGSLFTSAGPTTSRAQESELPRQCPPRRSYACRRCRDR